MDYQGQYILVARAGNAKSIEQATRYYFNSKKNVIDGIVIADTNGNLIHNFSNDDIIKTYEQKLNPIIAENTDWWKEIEVCVDLKIGLRLDFKSNYYDVFKVGVTLNLFSKDSEYEDCFTSGIECYATLGNEGSEIFTLGGKLEKVAYGSIVSPLKLTKFKESFSYLLV